MSLVLTLKTQPRPLQFSLRPEVRGTLQSDLARSRAPGTPIPVIVSPSIEDPGDLSAIFESA